MKKIFYLLLLLMPVFVQAQVTNFGSTNPEGTSRTVAKILATKYAGNGDTVILYVDNTGEFKTISKSGITVIQDARIDSIVAVLPQYLRKSDSNTLYVTLPRWLDSLVVARNTYATQTQLNIGLSQAQSNLVDTAAAIRASIIGSTGVSQSQLNDTAAAIRSDMVTTTGITRPELQDTAAALRAYTLANSVLPYLPELPVISNDFNVNANGITIFNGASFSLDAPNSRISVTSPSLDRGVFLGGDLTPGKTYIITVDITNGTTGFKLTRNWASTIVTPVPEGRTSYQFVAPAPGAFGTKPVLVTTGTGTAYLNYFSIVEVQATQLASATSLAITKSELQAKDSTNYALLDTLKLNNKTLFYSNDYSTNTIGTNSFNGGVLTRDNVDGGRLVITTPTATSGARFGGSLVAGSIYVIAIDIKDSTGGKSQLIPSGAIKVASSANGSSLWIFEALSTGYGNSVYLFNAQAGVTFVRDIKIYRLDPRYDEVNRAILNRLPRNYYDVDGIRIGIDAFGGTRTNNIVIAPFGSGDVPFATVTGFQAVAQTSTKYDPTASANGENAVYGALTEADSWRASIFGNRGIGGSTSVTGMGFGIVLNKTHATGAGRGVYVPNNNNIVDNIAVFGADGCHDFYIGNSWGHRFKLPPSGISIQDYTIPSNIVQMIHGQDSYDEKDSTSLNVNAGHLGLAGGMGTGTGLGGDVRGYWARVTGTKGSNQKNDLIVGFALKGGTGNFVVGKNTDDGTNKLQVEGSMAVSNTPQGVKGVDSILVKGINGQIRRIAPDEDTTAIVSGNVTMSVGGWWVFTGTTATWTLPAIASATGKTYLIKNRGTGNLTINSAGGLNTIYETSAINTITVMPGGAYVLRNDGTYWNTKN